MGKPWRNVRAWANRSSVSVHRGQRSKNWTVPARFWNRGIRFWPKLAQFPGKGEGRSHTDGHKLRNEQEGSKCWGRGTLPREVQAGQWKEQQWGLISGYREGLFSMMGELKDVHRRKSQYKERMIQKKKRKGMRGCGWQFDIPGRGRQGESSTGVEGWELYSQSR